MRDLRDTEFGKMLTERKGLEVVQIIFENGMSGVLEADLSKVDDKENWEIAKDIVESCGERADALFYFLFDSERVARGLVKEEYGYIDARKLPSL